MISDVLIYFWKYVNIIRLIYCGVEMLYEFVGKIFNDFWKLNFYLFYFFYYNVIWRDGINKRENCKFII